jgi:spermidine synthase
VSKRRRRPRHLPVRVAHRADGRLALEVGGVVQSIAVLVDDAPTPLETENPAPPVGYWGAMVPATCPRRALLLGLGAGTVAQLLRRRCPETEIVGIERDETVLATARAQFGLDDMADLSVVIADAFVWVPAAAERDAGTYDYICLDLFEAGRLAPGALATAFLRQVAALLTPGGTLAVNLMVTGRTAEQIHRLERVFRLVRTDRVRGNIVVHLSSS